MINDARVSQRALREIYLRGFEIAIREAKPWAVMSSYNRINGLHTQYSHKLLTDLLRKEWRFNGIVMTDWVEARDTRAQVHAGNYLLMGGTPQQVQDILDCVSHLRSRPQGSRRAGTRGCHRGRGAAQEQRACPHHR